jgi:hypothetical protein
MVSRRELLAGGVMGSFAGQDTYSAAQLAEASRGIADKLDKVEAALRVLGDGNSLPSNSVTKVRDAMMTFVRAHAKFPDYCDVGVGIFFDIYDWHVKNQRELVAGRQPDGRYALQFIFTRLLLRADGDAGYIGYPYDTR